MKSFSCMRCGTCCRRLGAGTRKDIDRIKAEAGIGADSFFEELSNSDGLALFEWEAEELQKRSGGLNVVPKLGVFDVLSERKIVAMYVLDEKICPFLNGTNCTIAGRWPSICEAYPLFSVGFGSMIAGKAPKAVILGCSNRSFKIGIGMKGLMQSFPDQFHAALQRELTMEMISNRMALLIGKKKIFPGSSNLGAKSIGLFSFLIEKGIMVESAYERMAGDIRRKTHAVRQTGIIL